MNDWTPTATAQPGRSGKYLVTMKGGPGGSESYVSCEEYLVDGWYRMSDFEIKEDSKTLVGGHNVISGMCNLNITDRILAWRPLPEPYKAMRAEPSKLDLLQSRIAHAERNLKAIEKEIDGIAGEAGVVIPIKGIACICDPCGCKDGKRAHDGATWHEGTCDVCGKIAPVTELRDFVRPALEVE